jgi:hypothetical protein
LNGLAWISQRSSAEAFLKATSGKCEIFISGGQFSRQCLENLSSQKLPQGTPKNLQALSELSGETSLQRFPLPWSTSGRLPHTATIRSLVCSREMRPLAFLDLARFSLPKLLRSKETSRLFLLRASQASVGAIGAGLPRPRSTTTTSRLPSASTISRGILCSGPSSTRSANP